ncbi:O-antigen ligase [Pseudomonas sp.]|uniref:O-antigen ligase family protein n=1 Tax=Pseudomonas sp. TaxID=306 RepID=UPI0027361331|nr:O-antigen ligase family protein [Pseudomonas sp.]MDP3816324.1 O-antigen ligase domain-containing protein [Pseudomonas sp.]
MSVRDKLYPLFQCWLALGLFLQLAGLCFITDGSRYTTIVNLMLFLPALLAVVLSWSRIDSWQRPLCMALLALLAWVLIVALFNEGSEDGRLRWLRVTLYAWLYLMAISLVMQNRRVWQWLLVAVVLVAGLCAWGSLVQALYVEQHGLEYRAFRIFTWGWRGLADFGNPIVAALYFGVGALVAAHLVVSARGIIRWLCLVALVGMLAYQYFTYSRGVWVGVLAGLATLGWFVLSRRLLVIAIVVATPMAVLILLLLGRAGGLEMSYRDAIFGSWLSQLDTFWLWGAGAGADANICIAAAKRCFNQAHSLYLQFFFEYGLPGLLLLLTLIGLLLHRGWRYRLQDSMAPLGLAMMVFTLVVAIANFYVIFLRPGVFWMVFWLPVGILLAVSATPRGSAKMQSIGAQ